MLMAEWQCKERNNGKRRVVVTGLGAINAIGHNVEETWKKIKEGVCGIGEITNYDKELTKVKNCW